VKSFRRLFTVARCNYDNCNFYIYIGRAECEAWRCNVEFECKERGKPRKPMSSWLVAGTYGCILTSGQQSRIQRGGMYSYYYALKVQIKKDKTGYT
jgi:hypothetical protein